MDNDRAATSRIIAGKEITVEVVPSALKHGKTEVDILAVLDYVIYDEKLSEAPDKTLIVGFDANGNPTEVILHELSDQHVVVFHAMLCRKAYLDRILRR
jgi:hypothetical protein